MPVLETIREHNPLLFDFVLKRTLRSGPTVFPRRLRDAGLLRPENPEFPVPPAPRAALPPVLPDPVSRGVQRQPVQERAGGAAHLPRGRSWTTIDPALLANLAAGIFILPFFLFSASAGQLADKYDKAYPPGW